MKSIARFLNGLESPRCSTSLFDVYMALVLILHDEHPEIRSYLVQSTGIRKFVDPAAYSVESPSLVSQDDPEKAKAMIVDLNEQMLMKSIIGTTLASARSSECEKEVLASFVNDFLVANFVANRLYREHQLKNFDDKIFFHEPPNKYCDLLWLQSLAFGLLCQPGVKELVDQARIKSNLEALQAAEDAMKEDSGPSEELELAEPPLAFEAAAQQYMLSLLADSSASLPKLWSTSKFLESIKSLAA